MFKNTLALTLAGLVTAAGAVSAQELTPAQIQLSTQAGVEPGQYTIAELHALIQAQTDDEDAGSTAPATSFSADARTITQGEAQLAELAGVEPGTLSSGEMYVLIKEARGADDGEVELAREAAIRDMDAVTPGDVQIAEYLNVDPTMYTTEELAEMYALVNDNDNTLNGG